MKRQPNQQANSVEIKCGEVVHSELIAINIVDNLQLIPNLNPNMKRILILLSVIFSFHSSYSQNNREDVVYLKNGSIIHGMIIEQVPNQTIKIQTNDRNVFVFKMDEIEKMTKETVDVKKEETHTTVSFVSEFKKKGFLNITEVHFSPNVSNAMAQRFSTSDPYIIGFKTVNGYQFSEHFSMGIGVGLDGYKSYALLPVTLDARISFLKGRTTPILGLNIGYAPSLQTPYLGGFVINPTIGLKTYISKNIAYYISMGLKIQYAGYENSSYYYYNQKTLYTMQFLSITTGFSF